jgi:hypothetical protein
MLIPRFVLFRLRVLLVWFEVEVPGQGGGLWRRLAMGGA